jgi:serine phosphatase RsbU (regulator of sigma subunit)
LLCQDLDKRSFVTAIAAFFDTTLNTMTFVRAGHLPIYHFRKTTDQVEKILPKGIGIGLNAKGTFVSELHEEQVPYVPGDILVFVTDGIIEARNAEGTEFGEGQLLQAIAKASDRTAEQVRDHILAAVKEFCGSAPQHDDQTMVVVRSIPG